MKNLKAFASLIVIMTCLTGCPGSKSEPELQEVNTSLLIGSWELVESIYDPISSMEIQQRDFTFTFDETGTAIKRYLDTGRIEVFTYKIIGESFVYLEANNYEHKHKILVLNSTTLIWHYDFGENLWYEQTFKRTKDVVINDVHAPEGAINGVFSVSKVKKVYFSKGNLTYLPCENRFRFQERQNDRCTMLWNTYTTDRVWTWEHWIDLFFWGTSGWNGGVYDYRPGTRNNENSYFYINNDPTQDMTGNYANADWGIYNKIENGGNKEGLWRVLSAEEVSYLFQGRTNAGNLCAFGYAAGVDGLFIFPDDFICPTNITLKTFQDAGNSNPKNNDISANDFALLEQLGVAFLPGCGRANYLAGTMIYPMPGWYWTSTTGKKTSTYVQNLYFDDEKFGLTETIRNEGHAVRLVQDVK